MPREQHVDIRMGLDELADAFQKGRVVVLRLKRRDHADHERIVRHLQALTHLWPRTWIWLEPHRVDAGPNARITRFWEPGTTVVCRARFGGVDNAIGALCGLCDQLELVTIDEAGILRERRRLDHAPNDGRR